MASRAMTGRRWPIGAMMLVVAALAISFAFLRRPDTESVAVGMAKEAIQKQEPGFKSEDYRVVGVDPIFNGSYWHVRFERVQGVGKAATEAHVNAWQVQMARRRFWDWEAAPKRPYFLQVDASGIVTPVPFQTPDEIRKGSWVGGSATKLEIVPVVQAAPRL